MMEYEIFLFGRTRAVISVCTPSLSYSLLRLFVLLVYVSFSNYLKMTSFLLIVVSLLLDKFSRSKQTSSVLHQHLLCKWR
jgi:hypothetical protein